MFKWLPKGLYARLALLNLGILLVVVSMILGLWRLDTTSSQQVLQSQLDEERTTFHHIAEADGQSLETLARDYSFWDDMVSFVSTHDQNFSTDNIDTSLSTYNVDITNVYNLDKKEVYSAHTNKLTGIKFAPEFFDKLNKERFMHFYVESNGDLVEIRAATIHPSDDEAHKTAPKGYWIVGRQWDFLYLQHLNGLTNSNITVTSKLQNTSEITSTELRFNSVVQDWNGTPVASVMVARPQLLSQRLQASFYHDIVWVTVLAILLMVGLYWFHQKYVMQPVQLISDSLRNNDPSLVSELAHEGGEFGDLAKAVAELDKQKNALKAVQEKNRELKKQAADYDDIKKELADNRNRVAKILEGVLKRGDK